MPKILFNPTSNWTNTFFFAVLHDFFNLLPSGMSFRLPVYDTEDWFYSTCEQGEKLTLLSTGQIGQECLGFTPGKTGRTL